VYVPLLTRLRAAAGILLGAGHRDSSEAVLEAIDVLKALPFADNINAALYPSEDDKRVAPSPLLIGDLEALRVLRQYHYDRYKDRTARGSEMQQKACSRMFQRDSRDAFQRTADAYLAEANRHLRFVATLNAFFPESDRVK